MKLEWDFRELFDFADNLNEIAKFEEACKLTTEEIAKKLLVMLRTNTPVLTGKLQGGWNGTFKATRVKRGFEVELKNEVEYASAVNDGHYSYNQFNKGGDPYVVKNRTVPYNATFGGDYPSDKTYVFGRFFVENSILQLSNTTQIEQIVYEQLQKWWEGCFNG